MYNEHKFCLQIQKWKSICILKVDLKLTRKIYLK